MYTPFVIIRERDTSKDDSSNVCQNEFEKNDAFMNIEDETPQKEDEEEEPEDEIELQKLAKQQLMKVDEEEETA